MEDLQHRLTVKTNELQLSQEEIATLEERIDELNHKVSAQTTEMTVLRNTISVLDKEKDNLQEEVDEKTEHVACLDENLDNKDKTISNLRLTLSELEATVELFDEALVPPDLSPPHCDNLYTHRPSDQEQAFPAPRDAAVTAPCIAVLRDDDVRSRETVMHSSDRSARGASVTASIRGPTEDQPHYMAYATCHTLFTYHGKSTRMRMHLLIDSPLERWPQQQRQRALQSSPTTFDSAHSDLAENVKLREISLKENRRLQDDLATMARENQTVTLELENAVREKEELKLRVHGYISEVSRIETLMAAKEQENRDLLDQFRMVHSQAEEWEVKAQSALGESSSIKMELLSVDTDRRHLRQRLEDLENEVQEFLRFAFREEHFVCGFTLRLRHRSQSFHQGHPIRIQSDNATAVAYINRQGGPRSKAAMLKVTHILRWAENHHSPISAIHIPGLDLPPELRGPDFDGMAVESWILAQTWFSPRVVSSFHLSEEIILPSFCPAPVHRVEKALHILDVVRALRRYISRAAPFRKSDVLFVLPEGQRKELPASKAALAKWIQLASQWQQHNTHRPVSPNDWVGEKDFTHMNAHQAYETQISSMAKAMAKYEEQLRHELDEKALVLSDLASVRELCVKLDSSKEQFSRQLTARNMEYERVLDELEDMKSEAELLKKQLASERLTIKNLETLLATNREKEFQSHLSSHEKESEIQLLKDKLTLAESK
ncbi:unnamed protein product, partial [Ranitomeya imitator]